MKLTTSLLALLLMISATVEAAVIERDCRDAGDGLLTYDTVNQREWPDLTETQPFKFPGETLEERYQAVLVETLPGGVFGGFTPATRDDVFTLAESAGIDTTTTDFDANQVPVHQLISMVGMTATSGGNNNIHSIGFLSDQDRSRFAMAIVWGPAGRASAFEVLEVRYL